MSDDVFHWVIAVAVVLACMAAVWQAIILAAIHRAGKEAAKAGKDAQSKLGPLADRFEALLTSSTAVLSASSKILEENRARISDITAETLAIVRSARQQTDRIGELVDDASGRAKARIAQIDETVDHTVAQVEHASDTVKNAVMRPVKEVTGIVAGVKAALNIYAQGGTRNSPEHATQDEEMFI